MNVESKGNLGGVDFTVKQRFTLSEDGKTLTIDGTFSSTMGEFTQKMIFDRQ